MHQIKLDPESITVETFPTADEPIITPASYDTTTGGPYVCDADCGSASECATSPAYC